MGALLRDMRMIVPRRFVALKEHGPDDWEGTFHDGNELVFRTERGARFLVEQCLDNVIEHRGLPRLVIRATHPPVGPRAA